MIEFFSNWVKGIGITIVIVSIIEMLLPNNKTKKYIQMLLGVFVIFNIISPLVQNKNIFDIDKIDLEKYASMETSSQASSSNINEGISKVYKEEIENDIQNKLEEKGYVIRNCSVDAVITDNQEYQIRKISLKVEKKDTVEGKLVTEVEKIKKVDTSIKQKTAEEIAEKTTEETKKLADTDIQNVKKFLKEEYGVDEKCLEIN